MSSFQQAILRVLRMAEVPYSHQKLDVRLTSAGSDPGLVSTGLLDAVRELERAGLVSSTPGAKTGHPVYAITDAGRRHLDALSVATAA